jgi:hypothetical protein
MIHFMKDSTAAKAGDTDAKTADLRAEGWGSTAKRGDMATRLCEQHAMLCDEQTKGRSRARKEGVQCAK